MLNCVPLALHCNTHRTPFYFTILPKVYLTIPQLLSHDTRERGQIVKQRSIWSNDPPPPGSRIGRSSVALCSSSFAGFRAKTSPLRECSCWWLVACTRTFLRPLPRSCLRVLCRQWLSTGRRGQHSELRVNDPLGWRRPTIPPPTSLPMLPAEWFWPYFELHTQQCLHKAITVA